MPVMIVNRTLLQCCRAFLLFVPAMLAACSSSSTPNAATQTGGGSGGTVSSSSGGTTAGVDAAVTNAGGVPASSGGRSSSNGGTVGTGGILAGGVPQTAGSKASGGTTTGVPSTRAVPFLRVEQRRRLAECSSRLPRPALAEPRRQLGEPWVARLARAALLSLAGQELPAAHRAQPAPQPVERTRPAEAR
jgi:hypothetical protein